MANFRTTADYVDKILDLSGETTNGNSAYEATALYYLNRIHNSVISGGIDISPDIDEIWPWALAPAPIILEILPKHDTGTLSLTNGSTAITFSSAPASSLAGWHFKFTGSSNNTVYRIISHTAGQTGATIEAPYEGSTESGVTYQAFKLDYELVPSYINVNTFNNKIPFTEATAGTELVATLTVGSYLIADYITELQTQLNSAGASAYTVTYSTVTRKFTITSDGAGADGIFSILGATGTEANIYASALGSLGFGLKDYTGALTYTGERALGAIARLSEPVHLHTGYEETSEIGGVDQGRFHAEYPLSAIGEGNPTRFSIVDEDDDGYMKIRFNRYPDEIKRVEIYYIEQPLDLYDNAKSHPLVPRKWSQILTHGAAAYLAMEKNDDRAAQYLGVAQNQLQAMQRTFRKDERRVGKHYGQIIARPDLMSQKRRKLIYGYEDD